MNIRPYNSALGAEVTGINIRYQLPHDIVAHLRSALLLHGLLVFRQQSLDPTTLARFARYFGSLIPHNVVKGDTECPDVIRIRKEASHLHNFGGTWHSDNSFCALPPMGAVLYARVLPHRGGDTLWSDQAAALATLPSEVRKRISSLVAVHSEKPAYGGMISVKNSSILQSDVKHPLVRVHPETGQEVLFICQPSIVKIVGLDVVESTELLEYLLVHATQEEFVYRHIWKTRDVVLWDNRRTLHKAMNNYHGEVREMLRASIADGANISTDNSAGFSFQTPNSGEYS